MCLVSLKYSEMIFDGRLIYDSELNQVWDRSVDLLSGGELQRFAIAMVCVQKADV